MIRQESYNSRYQLRTNVEKRHFTVAGYRNQLPSRHITAFKIVAEVLVVHFC